MDGLYVFEWLQKAYGSLILDGGYKNLPRNGYKIELYNGDSVVVFGHSPNAHQLGEIPYFRPGFQKSKKPYTTE